MEVPHQSIEQMKDKQIHYEENDGINLHILQVETNEDLAWLHKLLQNRVTSKPSQAGLIISSWEQNAILKWSLITNNKNSLIIY